MLNVLKLLVAGLVIFRFTPIFAQDAKLIEAAKKEGGKVVVYGSLEADTTEAVKKAFEKKTGLSLEYWRASTTKVVDRAVSEFRAKKSLVDVILVHDAEMRLLFKENVVGRYDSPRFKEFTKESIDAELGPRYRDTIIGIVYNKSMIKPEDAPKSMDDLLKPQFRGKLVMPDPTQHTTTTEWVASMPKIMGKEKGEKYIRDLAATKPLLVESLLPAAERVSSGESAIAITYIKFSYLFGLKGAPLDYMRSDKMLGEGSYIMLASKPAHSNAGKAFIDFFLDDESMKILAQNGEFVTRKGVHPPIPGAENIKFIEMTHLDKSGFAEKKKEYQKLFLQ
ncbi:MAG TPA: extracellular solute-binding protein [Candidatus Acidoferrales bacterium]|nr:extracellular solute-binding protein [Candidatus Acidoferrales bacterium]